jgi:hypothetical protein
LLLLLLLLLLPNKSFRNATIEKVYMCVYIRDQVNQNAKKKPQKKLFLFCFAHTQWAAIRASTTTTATCVRRRRPPPLEKSAREQEVMTGQHSSSAPSFPTAVVPARQPQSAVARPASTPMPWPAHRRFLLTQNSFFTFLKPFGFISTLSNHRSGRLLGRAAQEASRRPRMMLRAPTHCEQQTTEERSVCVRRRAERRGAWRLMLGGAFGASQENVPATSLSLSAFFHTPQTYHTPLDALAWLALLAA